MKREDLENIIKTYQKKNIPKLQAIKEINKDTRIEIDYLSEIWLDCKFYNAAEEVPGIVWDKRCQSWKTYLRINGKGIHLGRYKSKEEAMRVRREAERKYRRNKL